MNTNRKKTSNPDMPSGRERSKIEIFTSPTCPHCPRAVRIAEELAKERDDIKITETSTGTREGQKRAQANNVRSVPTLFIKGSGFPDRIGYVGVPSKEKLAKMVDISLGKEEWEEKEGLFSGLLKKLKIKI